MSFIENIQQLIKENKIKKALDLMAQVAQQQDKDLYNNIILQQARLAQTEQNAMRGISTDDENKRNIAQINYAILSLLDSFENTDIPIPAEKIVVKDNELPSVTPNKEPEPTDAKMHPVSIFISYSHRDEEYKDRLIKSLAAMRRQKLIEDWDDRDIVAGEDWNNAIFENLRKAKVVLLLVSDDFISSDFCYNKELEAAIKRHNEGKAIVIPIIIRPCDFGDLEFARFQAVPKNAKPVNTWPNQDEAWLDIGVAIKNAIKRMQ